MFAYIHYPRRSACLKGSKIGCMQWFSAAGPIGRQRTDLILPRARHRYRLLDGSISNEAK